MATIWVINEAGHSTYKALDLIPNAEIKPLTVRGVNPLLTDRLAYHLAEGIAKFGREEDYLLISGTPMINAMALLLWIIRFGEAKVLQWNAAQHRRCYELTTVTEENLRILLDKFMTTAA